MTNPTPDFNKNAFTLTPTQLGEWVFNEIQKRSSLSLHEQKLRYDHIRFLMAAGADPAWNTNLMTDRLRRNDNAFTLAMAAAYSCDVEALKILADFKVNLDTYDSEGMSPLLYTLQYVDDPAATKIVTECALFLISKGVDVNNVKNPDTDPDFPIIRAAGAGLTEVVEALIQAKADVNAKNMWGETALVGAVLKQKPDVVKLLLKAGADTDWVSSKTGKTLIELAEARASELKSDATVEVLQIIKEAAGKQNPPAAKGPQPKI